MNSKEVYGKITDTLKKDWHMINKTFWQNMLYFLKVFTNFLEASSLFIG